MYSHLVNEKAALRTNFGEFRILRLESRTDFGEGRAHYFHRGLTNGGAGRRKEVYLHSAWRHSPQRRRNVAKAI
jgi:hypothetical protein